MANNRKAIQLGKSKINAFVPFESGLKNRYLLDRNTKTTLLCHPIFFYLVKLKEAGADLGHWVAELQEDGITLERYGTFSRKEILYYYKKYMMLEENGYFKEYHLEKTISDHMTGDDVKRSLANASLLTFEVTDRCNLQCVYCGYGNFYSGYDRREKKDMDFSLATQILDYLLELWNSPLNMSHDRNIYIGFYGGEPLMGMPFIRRVVDYVKEMKLLHNRFSFTITTNAILLEKYMDYLVENDFNLLIILDGNESGNQYRIFNNAEPAFHSILKNITALEKKYPDYFRDRVNFNAVLHNKNSVSGIFQYFQKEFSKVPGISELNTSGIRPDQKEIFYKTYANVLEGLAKSKNQETIEREMFINLPNIQELSTFIHKKNDFCFDDYNDMLYPPHTGQSFPTGTCIPFSKKIFITVNGKILPCERIGHQFFLGQVTPKEVTIDHENIAKKYNAWFDRIRTLCRKCYNADQCSQCIFYTQMEGSSSVQCNKYLSKKDYAQYIASCMTFLENKPGLYHRILREVLFS